MRFGVYYGWLIAATTCVMAFVTMGSGGKVFGVFVMPMSAEFGWQRGTISLAAALGLLVSGLSQPFAGHLHDRWGGRTLILVSLVLSGLCTVGLALTTHLLFLILLFGVLRSIALSGCSLSMLPPSSPHGFTASAPPPWRSRALAVKPWAVVGRSVGSLSCR